MDNPFYGIQDEHQDAFDASFPLPEAGENEFLDRFCERKHVTIEDLVRIGARWNPAAPTVLQFWWPDGTRFRDIGPTARRWVSPHPTELKIISPDGSDHSALVIVEGESDGARMASKQGPGYDVLILGGVNTWNAEAAVKASEYERVLVALDADNHGDAVSKQIQGELEAVTTCYRWRPPEGKDWCDLDDLPKTPEPPPPPKTWVWGQELFELEYPDIPSYLEGTLLPTTGMMVIHGWTKSFKSWIALDLAVALATGGRWAEFETTVARLNVGIVQFEIPPFGYRDRMQLLYDGLSHEAKPGFNNIAHFRPLTLQSWDSSRGKELAKFREDVLNQELNVILFDPVRQMIGVRSMNDEEVQQQFVQFFRQLNADGVAVVCVHHDSKTGAKARGGSALDMTAGQVLAGAADSIVSVQLPKGDELDTSTRRNLRFTIRNGPPVGARGFALNEERIEYRDESWESADDGAEVDEVPEI